MGNCHDRQGYKPGPHHAGDQQRERKPHDVGAGHAASADAGASHRSGRSWWSGMPVMRATSIARIGGTLDQFVMQDGTTPRAVARATQPPALSIAAVSPASYLFGFLMCAMPQLCIICADFAIDLVHSGQPFSASQFRHECSHAQN